MAKLIKDKESYNSALAEINTLMDLDSVADTSVAEQLELLAFLVEKYEEEHFPSRILDPVEAIKFRMEQQNLKQSDLIPYIGGRSKVSEVLSGKRPLSLSMIRALHVGLGIPAQILLQEQDVLSSKVTPVEWEQFPIKEMVSRGWIKVDLYEAKSQPEKYLQNFFAPIGGPREVFAMYKQTNSVRSARTMDRYALAAWTARVMSIALTNTPKVKFQSGTVTLDFMREIARLSWSESGPILAQEFLRNHGISLIIEPQLPQTYLDGAAIMIIKETPVIGLSVRHDRIDNFWFCLMHELAHLSLHEGEGVNQFYDDLDIKQSDDPREQEADKLAGEALIPEEEWEKSPARVVKSPQAVQSLAAKLRIHPAIVAGRMRREYNSYHILNNLVGHGQVRKLFNEINWQ